MEPTEDPGPAEEGAVPPVSDAPPIREIGPTSEERTWAMLSHLAIFVFAIFGPMIIMLVKKDESEFVHKQAKEALNFQLAVLIVSLVSVVTCVGPLIVAVGGYVFAIMAGLEANKGVDYRYPYTFRLIQ